MKTSTHIETSQTNSNLCLLKKMITKSLFLIDVCHEEIPLKNESKKWKNPNFKKNYVTLRWGWGWMNWSGMIPKNETFSKDTMRGKFPNPTKNIFNSFTFGKNPKVDPNSEKVVNPLFFFFSSIWGSRNEWLDDTSHHTSNSFSFKKKWILMTTSFLPP